MRIPEKVRRNATLMGESGRAWLANLPQQIAALEHCWAITVGEPVHRGSEAYVAEARTNEGLDVILKIVMPSVDPTRQELRILRSARGLGYAGLIRADEINNAMLLEELGPQLAEFQLPEDKQIQTICATLREAWMPPPDGAPWLTGADKAVELSRVIESHWDCLGRPCSERTIELALSCAEARRRAFDPMQSVLVHGDAHAWNTLRAPDTATGFKFVDPDGALAERAFDLSTPMREWGDMMPKGDLVLLGRQRCRLLSRFAAVEFQPIWQWGLIQCVANGLLLLRIELEAPALVEFAMADAWAASADPMGP